MASVVADDAAGVDDDAAGVDGAADSVGVAFEVEVEVEVDEWLRETTATASNAIPTNTARTTRLEDFWSPCFLFATAGAADDFGAGAGVDETRAVDADDDADDPRDGTAGITTRSATELRVAFLATFLVAFLATFLVAFFATFLTTFFAAFFAGAFLVAFLTTLLAADFFATDFFATFFFATVFFAADFLAVFLTATGLLLKNNNDGTVVGNFSRVKPTSRLY